MLATAEELLELLDEATDADDLDLISQAIDELERDQSVTIDVRAEPTRADKIRAASSAYQRKAIRDSQDIGAPLEGLADEERRKQSDACLLFHLKTYHAETFNRESSEDHVRIIKLIQQTLDDGGQKAIALPRGGGKSSILLRAVLWAVLTRRRRFVSLISASSKSARRLMQTLKKIIRTNAKLHQDYGAELHCLISLGGRSALAQGQHVDGTKTNVQWESNQIASGYIDGVETSEFVVSSVSILGDVRGQQFITTTGETIRPDCVLLDDPQTKASAKSRPATKNRMELANGDVLKCAGGDVSMSAFAAVTIIRKGDMADQLVDRTKQKHWRGEKVPCVKEFPGEAGMALWGEFEEIYNDELDLDAPHEKSKQFVIDNFEVMHEGSSLFWMDNFDRRSEVSALHKAMIERAKDLDSFNAELQLSPTEAGGSEKQLYELDASEIAQRVTPAKRGKLPDGVDVLTAFIDIQQDCLFWMVNGFNLAGRAYQIDRGTFPDQGTNYFTKGTLTRTFEDELGPMPIGDQITAGLEVIVDAILGNEFHGDDVSLDVYRLGIDIGWSQPKEDILRFIQDSPHRARIVPCRGQYVGAKSKAWNTLGSGKPSRRQRGINVALRDLPKGQRGPKVLYVHTNYWKSACAEALTIPATAAKAYTLYDDTPENHLSFGEHWEAESPTLVVAKDGSQHIEWRDNGSGIVDNDWIDCSYNCFALASLFGVFAGKNAPRSTSRRGDGDSKFRDEFRARMKARMM